MIIKSIKIFGNKTLGNTVEFTLNPKYNHIDCDSSTFKIIQNAFGSFFKPEIALKPKIWDKKDFERDGSVTIETLNHPKKLKGFEHSTSLTFVRKVNHKGIAVTDDSNVTNSFTAQEFLNRIAISGITVPSVYYTNVDYSVSWIDDVMIHSWTSLTQAQIWDLICHGILCNDRMDYVQDWIFNARQVQYLDVRHFTIERDKFMENYENNCEELKRTEEYLSLRGKAETLKALIKGHEMQQKLVEKTHLEYQIQRHQKDVLKLEKESKNSALEEENVQKLIEMKQKLENASLTFENEHFSLVKLLEDDMDYKSFLQTLVLSLKTHDENFHEYKDINEQCLNFEIEIQNLTFLHMNQRSKITGINLLQNPVEYDTFVKSFEHMLESLKETLDFYEKNEINVRNQFLNEINENFLGNLIERLDGTIVNIEHEQKTMKLVTEEIGECLKEWQHLTTTIIFVENEICKLTNFLTLSNIEISQIEDLVAFETLLDDLEVQKSPLRDKFLHLLVREVTWSNEITYNPIVLECVSTFMMIVVRDMESAQDFMDLLPSKALTFVCMDEFRTRPKEIVTAVRRAQNREIQTVDQLYTSNSELIKNLMNDMFYETLLVPSSMDTENVDRNLYYDDHTFDCVGGVCGGGYIFSVISEIQEKIINFLDYAKDHRKIKKDLDKNLSKLTELKQKYHEIMHFPVIFDEKLLNYRIDLLDKDYKCKRDTKLQKMNVESVKNLILWLKESQNALIDRKEDVYEKQKELKKKIQLLEEEYEGILHEKKKINRKLSTSLINIQIQKKELITKYNEGEQNLIEIDSNLNLEMQNCVMSLTKVIDAGLDDFGKMINEIGQTYDVRMNVQINESKLLKKRLNLEEIVKKLTETDERLEEFTQNCCGALTKTFRKKILQEFPTLESQVTAFDEIQRRLDTDFFLMEHVIKRAAILRTNILKQKEISETKFNWPTEFLENIFVMQQKASCHAVSAIIDYVSQLASIILPEDVHLHLYLTQKKHFFPDASDDNTYLDLSMISEIKYGIDSDVEHITKEIFVLLVISSICCIFYAPFVVFDNIFDVFEPKYWDLISQMMKALSYARQIIVIRPHSDKIWNDNGKPDKIVQVRAFEEPQKTPKTPPEEQIPSELELSHALQASLQALSF